MLIVGTIMVYISARVSMATKAMGSHVMILTNVSLRNGNHLPEVARGHEYNVPAV